MVVRRLLSYIGPDCHSWTRSRRVRSPTTGKTTSRTVSSGRARAASAIAKRRPVLPVTFPRSAITCRSTLRSARAPMAWTVSIRSSTEPSTRARPRRWT